MNDPSKQLPVKAERDSLSASRAASHPTTDRMVTDLLSRGRGKDLATQRYRVGDYLLCLPDYQQIMVWAKHLSLDPIDLLSILDGSSPRIKQTLDCDNLQEDDQYFVGGIDFQINDGRIAQLFWQADVLGGELPNQWVSGLQINSLGLQSYASHPDMLFSPCIPSLRIMHCDLRVKHIDVSGCPNLESLTCSRGYGHGDIVQLDMSSCRSLRHLNCSRNKIVYLNFSGLDMLETLDCSYNKLDSIDLSACQSLKRLQCGSNQLTSLGLTGLDQLETLDCSDNKLDQVDLSVCQLLTYVDCRRNQLTALDLSGLPLLEALHCSSNKLTRIDLQSSPRLTALTISENSLTHLDTIFLHYLEWLQCHSNKLDYDEFREQNRVSERFICGDDLEIEAFSLGVRAYNILRRSGIACIKDLRDKSHEDIAALRHMNEKSMQEVIHVLDHQAEWTFTSRNESSGPN
jgi:hypothetical protein